MKIEKMRKYAVNKINRWFASLNDKGVEKIADIFAQEIERLNIKYFNDSGKPRDIKLVLKPWLIKTEELTFFHRLIFDFKAVQHKLFLLYLQHEEIRQVMPLRPEERQWFGLINKDKAQKYQAVFGRWDTNVTFDEHDNIRDVKFLENNTVGIGGIHYIPVVSEASRKILKIQLEKEIRPYRLNYQADPRHILAEEIKSHAKFIGRARLNVVFMEDRQHLGGTVELPELTKYFLKLGITAILADPRDLHLKGNEIYCRDTNIDIIYRDSELQELIDIERKGHNMAVLKQAFISNQVISSIAGELDHKSGFEIFSNTEFSRFFSGKEKALFKKYIPWTRILKERKTTDRANRIIELIPYVLKNKDKLVLKPNRAYGGKGILIGKLTKEKNWSECVQKALAKPGDYVAQDLVDIHQESYPLFNSRNKIEFDTFYAVSGFVVNRWRTAVLGRFSKEMVVNVARKGGIIPAFLLL